MMKVGFGATFSRTAKFSSLRLAELELVADSLGLFASASSPTTTALVAAPWANDALTVSTKDAFRPGWCISGCLTAELLILFIDCAERTDWESEL